MIELDGEVYHNAASAARYLHITRFMFYYNVKAKVQTYKKEGCKWLLYRQSDLEKFRSVLPVAS
jgi:hypothetical protein